MAVNLDYRKPLDTAVVAVRFMFADAIQVPESARLVADCPRTGLLCELRDSLR